MGGSYDPLWSTLMTKEKKKKKKKKDEEKEEEENVVRAQPLEEIVWIMD